ncbi:hypothetical protein [Microbacterium sp.]|uniref:hypothetical protein n=1 Tax=Microbacterium sp. TaxID=51671 RepID=UPI0039E5D2E8
MTARRGSALLPMAAVLGLLLTALLSVVGVSPPFAIAWGILLAVVVIGIGIGVRRSPSDRPPPMPPRRMRGSEVDRLAWSFTTSTDTAGPAVTLRVRELLRRRMARHGVDLGDAQTRADAQALLGPEGMATAQALVGGHALELAFARAATREHLDRALDVIDRLDNAAEEEDR